MPRMLYMRSCFRSYGSLTARKGSRVTNDTPNCMYRIEDLYLKIHHY